MTDFRYHYVVLPSGTQLQSKLEGLFQLAAYEEIGETVLYRSIEYWDTSRPPIEQFLTRSGYTRIFEKFWLPPETTKTERRVLVQALFGYIAPTYDSIITHDLNVNCYEHLYTHALKGLHREPSRLLDFGCGTGLITQANFASQVPHLRGFDFCPNMAYIAREKGLRTIDLPLQTLAIDGPFDVVLASYVFHYGLTTNEWSYLLKSVAHSGGVYGNFHKGIGLPQAITSIESLGSHYAYEITDSDFGPVLAVHAGP